MKADSLLEITTMLPDDDARIRFLENIMVGEAYSSFDNPVVLFREQLAISKRMGERQREFGVVLNLINSANYMGYFGLADSLSLHYITSVDEVELPLRQLEFHHEAAKACFFGRQYDLAIRYDTLALGILPRISDVVVRDSFAVDLYNYIGKSYNASGRFILAVEALKTGIDLQLANNPQAGKLGELYTELGIVYSQIGLYDRAVEYLDRNIALNRDPINLATNQINIGRNLLLTSKYTEARDRYLGIADLQLGPGQQVNILPYFYQGIIETYFHLDKVDSLNHYYAAFTDFLAEDTAEDRTDNFLYRQSRFFYELANDQLAAAEKTGQRLFQEAGEKNDPAERLMYTGLLAELYRRKGDFRQADAYGQELLSLKDSIQGTNRNNALLLYYNQFKTKEKENEILHLNAEQERVSAERRLFQTMAGFLALLLLTGTFFFFKLRSARRVLARQNEDLNHLNATKDRFFGIIAHDLRSPIVALKTADYQVERLYERGNTEGVKRTVRLVSDTAARLTGLLDNLLQWALGQSGAITLTRKDQPLTDLITENLELVGSATEAKGVRTINEVPAGVVVNADYHALQTILRNLIGNAVRYSPAQQGAIVRVQHRREAGMDMIAVSDNGPGIAEEEQERLFQLHRGEQADGQRKAGTGLGLILCREMAELHGGKIVVDSKVGFGSTFTVCLPG